MMCYTLKYAFRSTNINTTFINNHNGKYCQLTTAIKHSFGSHSQTGSVQPNLADQKQVNVIGLTLMANTIRQDITNKHMKYYAIRSSFIYHLTHNNFNKDNYPYLTQIVQLLSSYPIFLLSNHEMLAIYKLICFNMHNKSVQDLNSALKFVLLADQNISQSPIYLEFIRFYLQSNRQYIKVKYQIDFYKLSVWQAVKQFVGRTVQRGFLPRSPEYQRNLNILDHQQILCRLVGRGDTKDSLMIKKLNYTIFMQIKQYFEEEMRENLYHWKKMYLMGKFNHKYMRVLAQQLGMVHHQNSHLRQLYMKLYLTLPNHQNQSYPSLVSAQMRDRWTCRMNVLKLKNVAYLYNLALQHIARMDSYKLQQITQQIDVVIQFVQAVQHNLLSVANQITDIGQYQFQFDEMLRLIDVLISLKLQQSKIFELLIIKIKQTITPLLYSAYFSLIVKLINNNQLCQLSWLIETRDLLTFLTLQQLNQMIVLIPPLPNHNQQQIYSNMGRNIVNTILQRDFEMMGAYSISVFLNIYHNIIRCASEQEEQVSTLRIFTMRYIADHHKQFPLNQFENILKQLLQLPYHSCTHFDDNNGNYSNPIVQQLWPYINKIELLLSAQTSNKLRQYWASVKKEQVISDSN